MCLYAQHHAYEAKISVPDSLTVGSDVFNLRFFYMVVKKKFTVSHLKKFKILFGSNIFPLFFLRP